MEKDFLDDLLDPGGFWFWVFLPISLPIYTFVEILNWF